MKKHHYNTKPAISRLLQERESLRQTNDWLRKERESMLRQAADLGRQAERGKQLVRVLKWKDPQTDDVCIRYAVCVPRDQVMGRHDAEHLWAEALEQLAVSVTSDLAKYSMAAVTKVLWSNDAKTFHRAKREWMMNSYDASPHYMGLDPDTLSTAWDAAVAAILATAKS